VGGHGALDDSWPTTKFRGQPRGEGKSSDKTPSLPTPGVTGEGKGDAAPYFEIGKV